jgi:hypothetical protein
MFCPGHAIVGETLPGNSAFNEGRFNLQELNAKTLSSIQANNLKFIVGYFKSKIRSSACFYKA